MGCLEVDRLGVRCDRGMRTDREGKEGRKKGGKAYEIWIGFIVDAAFARGDADFEGERSTPNALLENCGGCHSFERQREARDKLGLRGEVGIKALLSRGCGRVSSLLWA